MHKSRYAIFQALCAKTKLVCNGSSISFYNGLVVNNTGCSIEKVLTRT